MNTSFLTKIGQWLDRYLLLVLASALIAFVPLMPKIPLFSLIEEYIVRVRSEDFLILLAGVVWVIQWLRGKVTWRTPFFWAVVAYAVVGALSVLSGMFITQTVVLQPKHVGKTLLHYFRYLEYFSLFFILSSAIKTKKDVYIAISIFVATLIGISAYGVGQKYLYWPVYSTMNREFSKGVRLYLTEHARVQSTFGGHYDLAAYLVLSLPVVLTLAFMIKPPALKVGLFAAHFFGLWLMIVSAARTSFAAYLIAVSLALLLIALVREETWLKKFWWAASRWFVVMGITGVMMLSFGNDMYERFLQVLEGYPKLHDTYHTMNGEVKWLVQYYIPETLGLKEVSIKVEKPEGGEAVDEFGVIVPSDTQPTTKRPSDVYEDIPDVVYEATTSADGTITWEKKEVPRQFSENAERYGLSLAIRLDTLWPQAIQGFKRNPLLGSGYATLNQDAKQTFMIADSTDNNFLRTLGETGLLGFITFYGIIGMALYFSVRALKDDDILLQALSIGYIAASVGLLLNAVYIDVYAASKVAQSYWSVTGLIMGYYFLLHPREAQLSPEAPAAQVAKTSPTKLAVTRTKTRAKKKRS
ncbi:MAG TPA: O-antigen ligase family protein [Vitreimonas sp.]|nr:O-antigen ligase family protein [Vitreimonas sp.]